MREEEPSLDSAAGSPCMAVAKGLRAAVLCAAWGPALMSDLRLVHLQAKEPSWKKEIRFLPAFSFYPLINIEAFLTERK